MATTNFTSGTTITSDWCNDVDAAVYQGTLNTPVTITIDGTEVGLTIQSTSSDNNVRLNRYSTTTAHSSSLALSRSRGTTANSYTIVQTGDHLGSFQYRGANGTGWSSAATIQCLVDTGTPSATSMPGKLIFSTSADGSTSPTIRQVIDSDGNVAVGPTDPVAGRTLTINKSVTGASGAYGLINSGQAQTDVDNYFVYSSLPAVVASASATLTQVVHYHASQGTFGAGSVVDYQYGFFAGSTLAGATSNIGFASEIPEGSGDWNFYASGTAPNYFLGSTYFGTLFGFGPTGEAIGGSVTQTTSKATGVTVDKSCGSITTHAAALADATTVVFTVINSYVAATDVIILSMASGNTAGAYSYWVDAVGTGTFKIAIRNESGGSLSEALTLNFTVIKAVNS